MKLTYCLYARKSSESKERQALSVADQVAECLEYAQRENIDIKSFRVFKENKSAYKPKNRPVFTELIELIKRGEVNAILTWKPDRLSRNPEEGGLLLQMLQDGTLKEIKTATGEVYTQESDHLILQIHFGMANQYSRLLSQNVRRGIYRKCLRKEYPRPALLGYEGYGEPGRKNIKPHPVEGPIISELFERASLGIYSLGHMVEWLEGQHLTTKRGKKIGKNHVYHILTTPTYYGYFKIRDELFEGSYEPLVSKTMWDRVQNALAKRSKAKINTWQPYLNGIIECGECGCAITTTVKKKLVKRKGEHVEYRYNHCTHKRGDCSQTPIPAEELENQLIEAFSQIQISEEVWRLGIELLKSKYSAENSKLEDRLQSLNDRLEGIQERKSRLIMMRADGEITKHEFTEQKDLLLEEQARINAQMKDFETSADAWLELAEDFLNTTFNVRYILESDDVDEKRNLVIHVGQNFILKDGKLTFQMREPYDVLLKPEYRTNVMPDLDSNQD